MLTFNHVAQTSGDRTRTEEAKTKRAREESSTLHAQNPLLACYHCKNCLQQTSTRNSLIYLHANNLS